MEKLPKTVFITILLVILNAVFWFVYAIISVFGGSHLGGVPDVVKWGIVILALGSAIVLVSIAVFLLKRKRFAFYIGLVVMAVIAVLSVTDEFGLLDLFSLLISVTPFGLMIKDRAWYLKIQRSRMTG